MKDSTYEHLEFKLSELKHRYGANYHLLSDVVLLTELAELSRANTQVARANRLVRDIYGSLIRMVVNVEFSRCAHDVTTRMHEYTERAVFSGELIDPYTSAVVVNIARAGTVAAQTCYEFLTEFLATEHVRQDHIYMNRQTDSSGKVIGTNYAGSKIGGLVADSWVLIPDPMGATGGSMARAVELYKDEVVAPKDQPAPKIIAMHLIVTPEYLRHMAKHHSDVMVYAVRLDRGMSDEDVLTTPLGTCSDREYGLTDKQYIVPGLGGLGEILNNSFV